MLFKERKMLADKYREWVKEAIEKNKTMVLDCAESVIAFLDVKGYLKENNRGKWIANQDGKYHCSKCDDVAPKGYRWNYCPNCGAEMRQNGRLLGNEIKQIFFDE